MDSFSIYMVLKKLQLQKNLKVPYTFKKRNELNYR